MRAIRSKGGRGIWSGWQSSPWKGDPLQHRPGPPHTMPSGSCGLGRRLPPRTRANPQALPLVRVAPLHDGGIAMRPLSLMPRSVLCGRNYRLMHADELRAGLVLWPEPMNAPCVHDVERFVKSHPFALSLSKGCSSSLARPEERQCFDRLSTNGCGPASSPSVAFGATSPWRGRIGGGRLSDGEEAGRRFDRLGAKRVGNRTHPHPPCCAAPLSPKGRGDQRVSSR